MNLVEHNKDEEKYMKLSDYVIDFVAEEGVSHVFEFIGGAIAHLLDSVYLRDDIHCISVRHEQAAAFAAEAYARLNGKLGVAMATSGPGALNLVTGIGSCYFDSVPCLFITGQVNTYEYKFDRPVRQIGFQETDIVSVVKSLTKYAELVTDPLMIKYHLEKAVFLAQNGRPGPVLIDIPMNLQRENINPEMLLSFYNTAEHKELLSEFKKSVTDEELNEILQLIADAERPVILAGGGVRIANAAEELQHLVKLTGIPVVSSLMGLDVIPHTNEKFVGLIGSYGNRYSNLVLANSDLILILGSRLDSRQTGTRPDTFGRAAKKIHVDADFNELNAKIKVDLAIQTDVKSFLISLNDKLKEYQKPTYLNWNETIRKLKVKFPTRCYESPQENIDPNLFMELLSSNSSEGDVICLDVGQHQMWASQSFKLKNNQRLLNSGGMGAMGFALPAAIGASLVDENRVIVIAGDGGIQVNIQEFDTIAKHNLPIKIFVMDNNCLGMVRQFQDLYFDGRKQSTVYSSPNLLAIARAYNIPSFHIATMDEAESMIEEAFGIEGPTFITVALEQNTTVNPKLVVNRPIEDMSPHLERNELRELMLIDLVEEMEVPK
ncbi:Acetolactate synthase isozyme 2 large subunit [Paenibacillus allorhizoplanae]|uniref:Acetolactate synthase isozyme 2 large subunit n=1 Tax=Paenibacillus allorhizoplanae TaxID=2905648 RepID=A0ABM9CD87_9BACL|nr:thiamine pyrophosphate-binding protein [Paenibacillus allorhizoplanae]CAH1208473.1 Acetolactate synthase isozyme 2 large subunit [Paenibacillus allorhizoplanae]